MRAGLFQQVHAQLLTAQPAAAPGDEQGRDVRGKVWEVFLDQVAPAEEVGAVTRAGKSGEGRRLEGKPAASVVDTERAGAHSLRRVRRFEQPVGARRVGRGIVVAAAVHLDQVAAGPRMALEQIDAAVHEVQHGVVGPRPPVAIGLGRFVAGEAERAAFLHDQNVAHTVHDAQLIGGGHACNAGAADDDFGGQRSLHWGFHG